jgi:Flp pilus assembly protein TadB
MGRLILLVLAGVVAVFVVTWIIHALMFFFLIALVVAVGIGFFRLGRRTSSRKSRADI